VATALTGAQKAAMIRAKRQPNYVDTPRYVTAVALVRRGYATWHDYKRGVIRLNLAGVRFARFGTTIDDAPHT